MNWKLIWLRGARVMPSGAIVNRRGELLGMRVSPGGYLIFDNRDKVVGTLTMAGRVYDSAGRLITQVERHDLAPPAQESGQLLALEAGRLTRFN